MHPFRAQCTQAVPFKRIHVCVYMCVYARACVKVCVCVYMCKHASGYLRLSQVALLLQLLQAGARLVGLAASKRPVSLHIHTEDGNLDFCGKLFGKFFNEGLYMDYVRKYKCQ